MQSLMIYQFIQQELGLGAKDLKFKIYFQIICTQTKFILHLAFLCLKPNLGVNHN